MDYEFGEVYSIKLANGDEIIGKVTDREKDVLLVSSPLLVVFTGQGIQLMPAMFTTKPDDELEINTKAIMMKAKPRQDVESHYLQATSGIALSPGAGSKSIVLG